MTIVSAAVCCFLSWKVFFFPEALPPGEFDWIYLTKESALSFHIPFAFLLDPLSKMMLLLVTTIATLVFIYSVGYMANEEGYARYFAGLSLFLFSMLGIILSNNFVMTFIFWELVGVSSYILIGHYYEREAAADACKQAFIVNRVGDFGFLIGILMIWIGSGSVIFTEIFHNNLLSLHNFWLNAGCIFIFCGAVGKSAQLPLHVWLPNSMEGPTPVSSLLHAATMVAAGVYMLARIFPILVVAPVAREVIAWIGALSCVVAALMATQQDDIKRILAYSTISQLGYMVLGVGVAAVPEIPMFHLFTHAFFKCLLFLAAGSVIVALHHEQDIWKMGGLRSRMPVTCLLMLIGGLALAGMPFFSGSFSKDLILAWAAFSHPLLFWIGAVTVALTAFYIARLFFVVFLGQARSGAVEHAREAPALMVVPMLILAVPAIFSGYPMIRDLFVPGVEVPHPEPMIASVAAIGFFFAGLIVAALLYSRSPVKDPLCIPFFANRFYIDLVYDWGVRKIQDALASGAAWVDRWVIHFGCVQGTARVVWGCGFLLRYLQLGNLRTYSLFFGIGVILFLFYLLFP